jgi:predicted nucleic acid-binding protein
MVAAVCSWHEHHVRASTEIENRLANRERMIMAAPALIESYSVLTRLPAPHRISPTDALNLLDANFMQGIQATALTASAYLRLLRGAPAVSIAGGRTYDAVIAACAKKANVQVLLTFNAPHFTLFAGEGLEIVVP